MSTHISVINHIQIFFQHSFFKINSVVDEIHGGHQCVFQRKTSITGHIICVRQIGEKKGNTTQQNISYLETSRMPNMRTGWRFCIIFSMRSVYPRKLVRAIEMRFNATHNKVCTGRHLLHFQPRMVRNKATVYRHWFAPLPLRRPRGDGSM